MTTSLYTFPLLCFCFCINVLIKLLYNFYVCHSCCICFRAVSGETKIWCVTFISSPL